MAVSGVTSWVESVLVDGVSTELRITASILIAVGALVVAGVVVPTVAARLRGFVSQWARGRFGESASETFERVDSVAPIGVLVTILIRLVQLLILSGTAFVLLVVWGQISTALQLIGISQLALPAVGRFVSTGLVLLAAFVVNDFIHDIVREYTANTARVTAHQEQILTRVLQVALILVVVVAVFTIWGIDIGSLLVGAGFLGVVIGLAARQTLGSLLAGFVLMFSRPFEIGDWVAIGEEEGIVTKITIMNTIMRNFDGEHVVIPNDNVANQAITNRSRDGKLRIHLEVGIDYDDDPEHAKEVAREAVEGLKMVENNPKPQVFPVAFGGSAVTLDIRFWIAPPTPQRRWHATAGVVESVKERFATESISIPFPQRTVSSRDVSEPETVTQPAATDDAEE
ncbi:mechanosensitive ion channel family protein [Halonotius terrestris]|uniref:Mechanosensitive ion channel family protein n=1 Tax=Halonotius terrestris TaxID=2487750 RepID=A0A8J8PAR4_9EURY|nr:mechanosensitive ion channel family protein [Halonotius terrestris]TQQ79247.1 mechanosensitive ion channel family protein [Halonotius terrestris]